MCANLPDKRLHSVNEACHILGLGRTSLYHLIKSKELSTVKIGRRTLIPAAVIDDFIAKLGAEART